MNRGSVLRAVKWIFSPSALFGMVALWIFMYASIAIWSKEAFGLYMINLKDEPLLQAPFIIFLVIATVNFILYAVSRFRSSWKTAFVWLSLPSGILLFLVGFFLCAVDSETGRKIVGIGDLIQPPWQQGSYVVGSVESGLEDEIIDIESGQSSLFSFTPRVFLDGMGKRHEVGVFPPTVVENTYYHIMDFGIAPFVRLERNGRIVNQGYVVQKLLPPGVRDSFELPPLPYRFALTLKPIRYIVKKNYKAGVYRVQSPAYDLVIQKGTDIIFDGSSDKPIEFDGMRMTFGQPDYWVWLEASRSPGLPVFAAGVVLSIAGVCLWLIALVFIVVKGVLHSMRDRVSSTTV